MIDWKRGGGRSRESALSRSDWVCLNVLQKMRCVAENEITEWLDERSIPRDPYHRGSSHKYYLQFYAPSDHPKTDAFVRRYYERITPDSETLIHVTDWAAYEKSDMITVLGIRSSRGEDRILIDAPGHILPAPEEEIGVSLFGLLTSFGWSSYLYSATSDTTLLNWEGEIFDFWTNFEQDFDEMKLMLKQFNLAQTSNGEQGVVSNGEQRGWFASLWTSFRRRG